MNKHSFVWFVQCKLWLKLPHIPAGAGLCKLLWINGSHRQRICKLSRFWIHAYFLTSVSCQNRALVLCGCLNVMAFVNQGILLWKVVFIFTIHLIVWWVLWLPFRIEMDCSQLTQKIDQMPKWSLHGVSHPRRTTALHIWSELQQIKKGTGWKPSLLSLFRAASAAGVNQLAFWTEGFWDNFLFEAYI